MLSRARSILPALALLLALGLAGLAGLGFERTLATFQPLGFTAVRDGGSWRVVEISAKDTGLLLGDRLILGTESVGAAELRARLTAEPETAIDLLRGEDLVSVSYRRPAFDLDLAWVVLVLVGAGYLLIGTYTAFRDTTWTTRIFFAWTLSAAAVFSIRPTLSPVDGLDLALFLTDQIARSFLPALTLHLFLTFPTPVGKAGRRRLLLGALYTPALLSTLFHLDQILLSGRWTGHASADLLVRIDRLELWAIVGASLSSAVLLATRLRRVEEWEARRQAHWIVLGLFGGYLPFLALYVGPWSLGLEAPELLRVLGVAPLGLVPLAFAWAILKYKLWDLGVIVKDSMSWTLTVFIGLIGFSLLDLGLERSLDEDLAMIRNLVTFGAGIALAGVLVPTRRAIRTGLERIQYRRGLGSRRALVDLGRELLTEHDLDEVCSTVIERLREALEVRRVTLLLASDAGRLVPYPDAEAMRPLPTAFDLDDLPRSLWQREVAALSSAHLPGTTPTTEDRLCEQGYRYALPLVVHDRPVALALFGYRGEATPLDSDDLDLARGLLDHAALAIENARLLREVELRLAEVARLEEHNKGILESSPAGIAVLDEEDRIISANEAFTHVASVPGGKLAGRLLVEILPFTPLPDPEDGLVDVAWCEAEGPERHVQISVARYPQPDHRSLRILVCHDTSERIALEMALQERERLASLGMLAAGVAHEVNTPLTGISSYAQMLLADTDPSDPSYAILKKMERQTFRASQIVNNLLDFSRNRRDQMAPVGLVPILDETVELLQDRAAESAVTLEWGTEASDVCVHGHEGELRQVFTNLVVNSIEALRETPNAKVQLEIEMDAQTVRVKIRDNGPGVPPERIEAIFQPFFSSRIGRGGTGLGLAITSNIVQRHRGRIHAANHEGQPGCTFSVELPRTA